MPSHSFPSRMSAARLERLILQEAEAVAESILAQSQDRKKQAETYARIRGEIQQKWEPGWKYFDGVIYAMQQSGLLLSERAGQVEDDHSLVRHVLCMLHSNATTILYEIRTLLSEGLWSGGAGRWRALHELTVTAKLIAEQGADLAERYLNHSHVVQTERLARYWEAHHRGPVPPDELARRKRVAESLVRRFTLPNEDGRTFKDTYGWAAPLMPIGKSGKLTRPTFDKLEKLAGLEDLRLLVNGAHGLVHADSGGVVTSSLVGDDGLVLGPIPDFVETVARPALLSARDCIGATHLGYEPAINEFAQVLTLLAAGAMKLAGLGVQAFEVRAPDNAGL